MRVYLLIDTNIEMERLISYKKKRKKKKWRDWLLIKQKKKNDSQYDSHFDYCVFVNI